MDMNPKGPARYRRLAGGLALAAALAMLSLALIGGLFGWLMDALRGLGAAGARQASSAMPLMAALVVALGLLLRWRLRSSRKKQGRDPRHLDLGS